MTQEKLRQILLVGETVAVEFKRCGNGIEADTYESVCSFLNRFGGDIFLGVENNGTVRGVSKDAAPSLIKNFVSCVSNPDLISPTVYLDPEIIEYESKTIIHIHVHSSSEVHSFKKVVYDRIDDADVKVTATNVIAQMYIRKQNIFTERKIYPFVKPEDLQFDLMPAIKNLAATYAGGTHAWQKMDDMEIMKSAGLYALDRETEKSGFNLAGILLFGRPEVIKEICPTYVTDALFRKVNVNRYDDRDYVDCNLIEAYDRLLEFGAKHLNDKFFIDEDLYRKSLSGIIVREMISNTLIHREYSSSFIAKFVIEKDRMYTENANRANQAGEITPENLQPNPKNPILANFFRIIGRSDVLGSGTRNLFHYGKLYSGKTPQLIEGDVFRVLVPIDDEYSYENENIVQSNDENYTLNEELPNKLPNNCAEEKGKFPESSPKVPRELPQSSQSDAEKFLESYPKVPRELPKSYPKTAPKLPQNCPKVTPKLPQSCPKVALKTFEAIKEKPDATVPELHKILNIAEKTVKNHIAILKENGLIERAGTDRSGYWLVKDGEGTL